MNTRKIKKNITKSILRFPEEMYSDTLGSLGICGWIFTDEKSRPKVSAMKSKWKKILKGESPVDFTKSDFVEKALRWFGMEVPELFPVAFVQSDWNAVFAPYVGGNILPNREDGFVIQTLRKGKIYPLNMSKEEADDNLGRNTK